MPPGKKKNNPPASGAAQRSHPTLNPAQPPVSYPAADWNRSGCLGPALTATPGAPPPGGQIAHRRQHTGRIVGGQELAAPKPAGNGHPRAPGKPQPAAASPRPPGNGMSTAAHHRTRVHTLEDPGEGAGSGRDRRRPTANPGPAERLTRKRPAPSSGPGNRNPGVAAARGSSPPAGAAADAPGRGERETARRRRGRAGDARRRRAYRGSSGALTPRARWRWNIPRRGRRGGHRTAPAVEGSGAATRAGPPAAVQGRRAPVARTGGDSAAAN